MFVVFTVVIYGIVSDGLPFFGSSYVLVPVIFAHTLRLLPGYGKSLSLESDGPEHHPISCSTLFGVWSFPFVLNKLLLGFVSWYILVTPGSYLD